MTTVHYFSSSLAFIELAVQVVSAFGLTKRVLAAFLAFFERPYTTTLLRCTIDIPATWRSNWSRIDAFASPEAIENYQFVYKPKI